MRKAKLFLELLTMAVPPMSKASHALVWQDGTLRVAIHPTPDQWMTFNIDEADMDKTAEQLVEEVVALVPARD
jgi:hypothetical protein